MSKKEVTIVIAVVTVIIAGAFAFAWKRLTFQESRMLSPTAKRIGILVPMKHPVADAVIVGIKQGFAEAGYEDSVNVVIDLRDEVVEPDGMSAAARAFAAEPYDVLIPVGTPAAQVLMAVEKSRPVVFAGVLDPIGAGIVQASGMSDSNLTGTSTGAQYKGLLLMLKALVPTAQVVGNVHNAEEQNSRFAIELLKTAAKELNLTLVTATSTKAEAVPAAAASIAGKVDGFVLTPDNTVAAGTDGLIAAAKGARKPVIAFTQDAVEKGALAALGTDYVAVGRRTAALAIRVLKGEAPGSIPVDVVNDTEIFVNFKTADDLGVTMPASMVDEAKKVYRE